MTNPSHYTDSVVNGLIQYDTSAVENQLIEILSCLDAAKYNMYFAKQENYQILQQAVKQQSFFTSTFSSTEGDFWIYTGMLKKNLSLIPNLSQNTYF